MWNCGSELGASVIRRDKKRAWIGPVTSEEGRRDHMREVALLRCCCGGGRCEWVPAEIFQGEHWPVRLPFTPSQFSASACALLQLQGRQLLARFHSSHQPPLWHFHSHLSSHPRDARFSPPSSRHLLLFRSRHAPAAQMEVYLARRNPRIAAPRIRTSSPPFPTTPNCK